MIGISYSTLKLKILSLIEVAIKASGNMQSLKWQIRNNNKSFEKCPQKECVICKKDLHRDYEKYMKK